MALSRLKWSKRDWFRTFFRFRRRGLAVFVGTIAAACLGLLIYPREYVSEAKLLVRLGRENVALDPTVANGAIVSLNNGREAEINSVIQSLASRSNMEKVLDTVGPERPIKSPLDRERVLTSLTKDITVHAPKNSTVIVLSCLGSSPERAQQIAQTLLDICLKEHVRINRTSGSYGFFDEQAVLLKSQLDQATFALRDAKNRHGLVTLDGRRASLQQQISGVELQQQETNAGLAASQAKTIDLAKKVNDLSPQLVQQMVGGTPNDGLGDMRQKLYELETQEQELLSKKTTNHPLVIAIQQQVREAKQILAAESPRHEQVATALMATERSNAAGLQARADSLAVQHRELKNQLEELNRIEPEIVELERQVKLLDANYVTYVKGLEQSRIDDALKNEGISNLSVIQSPSFVPKPAVPKKGLVLILACIAALGAALGVVLLSDHLDESIRSISGAEQQLQLQVFTSLPYLTAPPNLRQPAASNEYWRAYV
jgi:uncharacterized protein involved in exopolysaccharide biosynthesis